ncbi:MAG: hypothetical protein H0U32_07420, partial [Thermoleophilaceae bacterium]|nr:hypothetical protein [Thermoleophilaceae bacterium]
IYPARLFLVILAWLIWVVCKGLEWGLHARFWLVRRNLKKRDREGYAAYWDKTGKAP